MRQLVQKLKDGKLEVIECPEPLCGKGMLLVSNRFSVISTGTEISTVKTARKGVIGKIKERPQQFQQVLESLKTQGVTQTYRAVMKKLDAYSPLGYSCAGEVIGIGDEVKGFEMGDSVACGGLTAAHAEVVAVPVNLCVKLSPEADFQQAAYNTLGAIAINGIRQADVNIGETVAVIGLGILGQLTCLILKAGGIKVVGIDINHRLVEIAKQHCADIGISRDAAGLEQMIETFSGGIGCDAVVITAATSSTDPVNLAGAIARKKGKVVIVGDVPAGFDRNPHYYPKELQLRMACSYGPGRYDPEYEEKGRDYPAGYVRWTENRNMQAFQSLIHSGKVDVSYLSSHVFPIDKAPKAYEMVLAKEEPYLGLLVQYEAKRKDRVARINFKNEKLNAGIGIGFIGAGSYAQSHLLPNIPADKQIALRGVMAASGTSAKSSGERYGFEFCTTDDREILDNGSINTVFIATRHDSHFSYVASALKKGKHVFVEKPLCLTAEELEKISSLLKEKEQGNILMVGYNRRFSPALKEIKRLVDPGPVSINYRINAGNIPRDSWIQDTEIGGGRIIGEVCHFVDSCTFLAGSLPVSLFSACIPEPGNKCDTVQTCIKYQNGSTAVISYLSNGDRALPKELLEVFSNGVSAVVNDFRSLTIYRNRKKSRKMYISQNKGQKDEITAFLKGVKDGIEPIPVEELLSASRATFKMMESLKSGKSVEVF
jgi:predicted dehydrogenase